MMFSHLFSGAAVVSSGAGQLLVIFLAGIDDGKHPGHSLFAKDGGRFLGPAAPSVSPANFSLIHP